MFYTRREKRRVRKSLECLAKNISRELASIEMATAKTMIMIGRDIGELRGRIAALEGKKKVGKITKTGKAIKTKK